MSLQKIMPPTGTYISKSGAFDLEHGVFIKCSKETKRTIPGKKPMNVKTPFFKQGLLYRMISSIDEIHVILKRRNL